MDNIIIIGGPTATGKTAVGISLAKLYNGEVISADSMQVYKQMSIGTAAPSEEEISGIAHYLVAEINPDKEYNVSVFKSKAEKYINDIISRGKVPIIIGGTGLYIDALLYNYNLGKKPEDNKIRTELEDKLKTYGAEYMHDILKKLDRAEAEKIHKNNTKRVLRALEIYYTAKAAKSETVKKSEPVYNAVYICLNYEPRSLLYERINKRVDIMFDMGLLAEAKRLYEQNYDKSLPSMQAIGYKELFEYFDGNIELEEAKELIKKRTRNYAKRQLTWFKNNKDVKFFTVNSYKTKNELLDDIRQYIKEKTGI